MPYILYVSIPDVKSYCVLRSVVRSATFTCNFHPKYLYLVIVLIIMHEYIIIIICFLTLGRCDPNYYDYHYYIYYAKMTADSHKAQ